MDVFVNLQQWKTIQSDDLSSFLTSKLTNTNIGNALWNNCLHYTRTKFQFPLKLDLYCVQLLLFICYVGLYKHSSLLVYVINSLACWRIFMHMNFLFHSSCCFYSEALTCHKLVLFWHDISFSNWGSVAMNSLFGEIIFSHMLIKVYTVYVP